VASLTHQILANRLVVLYARSGLGKTSLLNAGIAENLRTEGLLPLTVRVNDCVMGPVESVYRGIAAASAKQEVEYIPGDKASLWHFCKTAEFWAKDVLQTPVLILDQFEELFTLQSDEQRRAFISQLSHLIRGVRPPTQPSEVTDKHTSTISDTPPRVKILISLREDFLPHLDDLADQIPEVLDQRFRLQPLARAAASRALEEPARVEDSSLATRPFELESQGRDAILDFLARRAPSSIRTSSTDIEPFQLQLICQRVEEIAERKQHQGAQNGVTVTRSEIGEGSSLKEILEDFYVDQVRAIPSFRQRRAVKRLCSEFLISLEGRRLRMEESEIKRHVSVTADTLRMLVDHRLLRAEQFPEGTYYELSHDSLIKPVSGSKRWSFALRAGGYLVIGIFSILFGVGCVTAVFALPFSSKGEELVIVLLYALIGWFAWVAGVRNIKKFIEMRRRSKIVEAGVRFLISPAWVVSRVFRTFGLS